MGKKKIWEKQKTNKKIIEKKKIWEKKKKKTLLPAKGGPPHALSEPAASGGQRQTPLVVLSYLRFRWILGYGQKKNIEKTKEKQKDY